MKLKNKKTVEIGYFCFANYNDPVLIIMDKNGVQLAKYNSLAELNAEWEDYEEPKLHYSITQFGYVRDGVDGYMDETIDEMKEIGNYFDTREEAEKALEKLKAWKRLKDKGFSIDGYTNDIGDNYLPSNFVIKLNYNGDHRKSYSDDVFKDLDLLFGDEDE